MQRVVIIGGGFGGLYCARRLGRDCAVTLLDRRNFHLFQPLLYQVATGGLSPANIAVPLRSLLRRRRNVRVLLGEAVDLDLAGRSVLLDDGAQLGYDTLIVATGTTHAYFGRDDWEQLAPGLKTLEDAVDIRRRVLSAFELAEREPDLRQVARLLTFVIAGGGPTGVELAGAIAEIARDTLRHDFRSINPGLTRIFIVEGKSRVLGAYPASLALRAAAQLRRLGVELLLDSRVTDVTAQGVTVRADRDGREVRIEAATVLWAAGVRAAHFGAVLAERTGCERDRLGRLLVAPDLSIPGYDNIFVVGDLANYPSQTGEPLPGVAQVAMQQGAYVARMLNARERGGRRPAFRYRDYGTMATIGRAAAVCDLGRVQLWGWPGWLAWLFIHLLYIVQFHNKLLVLIQWAWNYVTRGRTARLITGEDLVKPASEA